MTKLLQDYNDFGGGLCVDLSPDTMPDNCLSIADNVDIANRAIRKRAGSTKLNSTSYAAEINRIIEWPRNDGTTVWLAVKTAGATITLNRVNQSTGALTSLCTLNKADIGWFFWQDKFYFLDGAAYRYYDGTGAGAVLPATPTLPTLANITGASPTHVTFGTHRCAVTFVNSSGKEGALGEFRLINVPEDPSWAEGIGWSDIPVGDGAVASRKLYRTEAGMDAPYYLVATISDNTATTYNDYVSDGSLGDEYVAPTTELAAILRCNKAVMHPHSQRLFVAGDTSDKAVIYYSDPGDPSEFQADHKRYPPTGNAEVKALGVFGDAVVVHYEGGHMRWKGTDPATDVTWYQMPVEVGLVSPLAVEHVPNALMFLGQGGPYIVSPAALETNYILQAGDSIVKNIAHKRYASLFTAAADLTGACAVYDHLTERLLIAYKAEAGSTGNDRIVCIEWNFRPDAGADLWAASLWKGIHVNHFCLCKDGTLLAASTNYILKLNQTVFTDINTATGATTPVVMKAKTKAQDLGYGKLRKKLFSLFFTTEAVATGTVNLTVSGGVTDVVKTGLAVAGGGTYETKIGAKGEKFSVQISNSSAHTVKLNSLAFEFKPLRAKGEEV